MQINLDELLECPNCQKGYIVPLEDYSQNGTPYLRAWVCTNCGNGVTTEKGNVVKIDTTRWK